ncbi:leucyl aminopeptidase [Calidifontibacter terrae]
MTTVTLTDRQADKISAPVLVVMTHQQDKKAVVTDAALDAAVTTAINEALAALGSAGSADEIVRITGIAGAPSLVIASGSGLDHAATDADTEAVRRAAGAAARALADKPHAAYGFPCSTAGLTTATVEGALFGSYEYTAYRATGAKPVPLAKITVSSPVSKASATKAGVKRAQVVADSQAWARDLVNQPPLDLFPASFAAEAKRRFTGTDVKVAIQDEKQLAKANCGGLVGVGRGSSRPPRLVTLTYKPARAKAHIALVGKGITFDSGGLCIKPGAGMVTMKCDMAGAASVAAAIDAIATLGLPVAVTGYLCLAENLTGSDAQRPGDVVTMPNGKSVEIINTDAEGRLVMADGLCFASEQNPDLVIDVATLTGAAVMSLGPRTSAVLSNDDNTRAEVLAAAEAAGEAMWPIPLLDELRPSMNSQVADVKHTGERMGGMITAALFLREFVGDDASGKQLPWAHLDIAGPAFNEAGAYGYTPAGGTGHSIRTLIALAEARG